MISELNAHFDVLGSRNIQAGSGGFYFYYLNSTHMTDNGSDGILQLTNNATSSFTRLTLGPIAGGSFPALQPNGVNLDIEKSDGSARTGLRAANVTDDALTSVGSCVQSGVAGILANAPGGPCLTGATLAQAITFCASGCTQTGTPCSTASSANAQCTNSISWPTAFADHNYAANCTGTGTITGFPFIPFVTGKLDGSLTVTTSNGQGSAAMISSFSEIDCTGIHP